MLNRDEGVRVTRMDESDYGTEVRVEVVLGGRTLELQVADGHLGFQVELVEYGPDTENPYHGSTDLLRTMLEPQR